MKKVALLFTVLLLTGCARPAVPEDRNENQNVLPLYMNFNNNTVLMPAGNANGSLGQEANTNINALVVSDRNENENRNAPVTAPVKEMVIDVEAFVPHETPFDCKALSVYEGMPFFSGFRQQYETLPRYSINDLKGMLTTATSDTDKQELAQKVRDSKETQEHITSVCLAKDQSLLVAVVEGDAGGYGFKVLRYRIPGQALEVAEREDSHLGGVWHLTPTTFGKRTGTVLALSATGKKGNKTEWFELAYDYVTNHLTLAEYCYKIDGQNKTCGAYPY